MSVVQNQKETELWSMNRISVELSMDRRTVTAYLKDTPPSGMRRGHPAWALKDFIIPIGSALSSGISIPSNDPTELPPKDRKDWYQSENERLKFMEAEKSLIPVEETRAELAEFAKPIVQALDCLVDVVERDTGASRKVLTKIQEVVDSQRDEIHRQLTA